MEILLFGDQTADQQHLLRKLVQRKDHAVVVTFLERAAKAIREEVRKLPRARREAMPNFLTINNLVDAYFSKGFKLPELESTLVTVAQLAHYLGYAR
jgi:vacuolar-type H+-ATPase subunit F/Vma7